VALARVPLGIFPTPLQHMPDLGGVPGLRDLHLKRDDLTGFSWGGNKVRTVEYVLGEAISLGSDVIVVAGGPTSNFAALLAVAASGRGLAVTQVCYGEPRVGVAALAVSMGAGARVEFTGSADRSSMDAHAERLAECHRAEGRQPYVVPRGGATPMGSCGFASAALELVAQLDAAGLPETTVVLPVGSGGSIAGLVAGLAGIGDRVDVVGVSVSRPVAEVQHHITVRAKACAQLLGSTGLLPAWRLVDGRGEGYGGRSPEENELTARVLRTSGFVADPVYNAKALMWLEQHRAELSRPIVYWSTGGALASADCLIIEGAHP
jgi:1-aminocyclopropane-1-carboxylate deaminase/D-cysteine desulfhydrase-like pyridoxal-dependent ACC family enzyme